MTGKKFKFHAGILVLLLALFVSSISSTYGYWLGPAPFTGAVTNSLTIGDWFFARQYSTGFEGYTNTTYGTYTNQNIDGKLWDFSQVITATDSADSYFGTRGLRFRNTSYIQSKDSYYGLESISFYFGDVRGGFFNIGTSGFNVQISNDGSSWTTIYSANASASFPLISINVENIISGGYTLGNGAVVDMESDLYIRINFTGAGLWQDRLVNMDNLTINYRSVVNS